MEIKKKIKKISSEVYLLMFLIAGATIVRLLTLNRLMVFTPDEEYLLYLSQTIIKDFHIIWIGVSALGFDYYMGPFWVYIISPFVSITKGDPLVLGVMTSVIGGVFTISLIYFLGREIFNKKTAVLASLLYATSSLMIYYDQQPYPPAVPFLSLLIAFSLFMTKKSKFWWIVFAVSYGMVFHVHLSLVLMIFVALYIAFKQRKLLTKQIILLSVFAFVLTVSPLIVFDYYHNASNITAPIRVLKAARNLSSRFDLGFRVDNFMDAMGRIWYLAPYRNNADEILYPCIINPLSTTTRPNRLLSIFTVAVIFYFAVRKKTWKNSGMKFILFLSFAFVIPFLILPAINPIEYYLLGFFPFLFLIIAALVDDLKGPIKFVVYVALLIIMFHGLFATFTANGDFGIETKKKLIVKVMNVIKDSPYELSQEGECHRYGGWRYLFSVYARKPEGSDEDKTFAWLYPDEVSSKPTKYSVVIEESRSNVNVEEGYKFAFEEGGFTSFIFEK